MKVKDLIKELEKLSDNVEVLFSGDNEGNIIFKDCDIATLEFGSVCIYPLSGSEIEL